jgi:hypothetical protein
MIRSGKAPRRPSRFSFFPHCEGAAVLRTIGLPDEFQDGRSAGSLVRARRCWLDLMDAGGLHLPQRFTFRFQCPTERMAAGLTDFLRYAAYGGFVRLTDTVTTGSEPGWLVAGTTPPAIWSLASLEHLFMRLRGAGARYDSALATLHLLPLGATVTAGAPAERTAGGTRSPRDGPAR